MLSEGKTIGQLMEEMRAKAGAQNYHGHGYMAVSYTHLSRTTDSETTYQPPPFEC